MSIFKSAKRQVATQEQKSTAWEAAANTKDAQVLADRRAGDLADAERYVRLDNRKVNDMLDKYIKITAMTSISIKVKTRELKEAWRTWEEGSLGLAQQAAIYRLYAQRVPAIIQEYFKTRDEWPAVEKLDTALLDLSMILSSQVGSLDPMPLPESLDTGSSTSFPELAIINPSISKQVADLQRNWAQALSQASTVEDKFFLEQITLTYLPDMWRMYQPFAGADSATRDQAAKLVSDQVTLLTQGVQRILDSTRGASLRDLEAHKNFLQQRLAPQALTLPE